MFRFIFLLFLCAISACANNPTIQPAKLAARIQSDSPPLILDVRTQAEYDAGHVPGAILIPHDQLESRIGELGETRRLVLYCKSGRRAGLVQPILAKHGFKVKLLDGSWQAWQSAKLPVQRSADE